MYPRQKNLRFDHRVALRSRRIRITLLPLVGQLQHHRGDLRAQLISVVGYKNQSYRKLGLKSRSLLPQLLPPLG